MAVLRLLIRTARGKLLAALVLAFIAGVLTAALIGLVRTAVAANGFTPSPVLAASFTGVALVQMLATFTSTQTMYDLSETVLNSLRLEWARRFMYAPLREIERIGPARVQSVLSDDISIISTGAVAMPQIAINVSIVLTGLAYIAWTSPPAFGFCLVGMIVGVSFQRLRRSQKIALYHGSNLARDHLFSRVADIRLGAKELRQNQERARRLLEEHLVPRSADLRAIGTRTQRFGQTTQSAVTLLTWIVVGLLLFWMPLLQPQTRGFAGGAIMLIYLVAPLSQVMTGLLLVSRASVTLEQVEQLVGPLPFEQPAALTPPPFQTSIRARGITHRYHREEQGDMFELGPIDLDIHVGEILFIVGGNGSGKTTLAKLLTGLYTPDSGSLSVDDASIRDEDRAGYRQLFAAVFSDCHLFDWLPVQLNEANGQSVRALLDQLGLGTKVKILDDGRLSTLALSTGQRKRLALLSAFLEERPVFLFDEWAADQDPAYRRVFYEVILPDLKRRGRTCIVISHDEQYFGVADRLVKIESGQIASIEASGEAPGEAADARRLNLAADAPT